MDVSYTQTVKNYSIDTNNLEIICIQKGWSIQTNSPARSTNMLEMVCIANRCFIHNLGIDLG